MSASPDFMQQILQSLNSSMYSPTMGLAAGLLQAGGPSRMPVSLGQALGQGLQTGQQFQQQGLQNAMSQLQFGKQLEFMRALQSGQGMNDPNTLAGMAALSGNYGQASDIYSKAGNRPMTDDEIKQYYGAKTPGMAYFYNDYTHTPSTSGESQIGTVSVMTPRGTMATVPYNKATGNINDVGGVLKDVDYSQPLSSSAQEQAAQDIAAGRRAPPTISSRNPGAADQLARADAIIKAEGGEGYDASTWPAKQKSAIYWNTGPGAQQITSFNAAESHLETLKPLIDNLGNTQSPAFNHLKNFFAAQTGSTAPTDLAAAKQYVGAELAKVVTGSGGTVTEGDRLQAANALSQANTPQQLKDAIAIIQNLIGGKMLALKTQYKGNGMYNFEHRLEGPSISAMQNFEQTQTTAPTGSLPQGWTVQVH